jgi:hypothetical protein
LHPSQTAEEGWEYNETALRLFKDNEYAPDCHKIAHNSHKTCKSNHTEEKKYEKLKSALSVYVAYQTAVLRSFLIKLYL